MNTISIDATSLLICKKSKFIANLYKISSESQALDIIKNIKKNHHKAAHHVYAFIILKENGQIISKYSDDKEPKGTAGRPIMFLLQQERLANVLVIITRYFGGTLLGKGGLARAYTKAVKLVLDSTEIIELN